MKFYVCGKIGKENPSPETLAKFKKAEDMLRSRGHDVFNPTTSGLGKKADELAKRLSEESGRKVEWYDAIMLLDLEELAKCDAICLLDDWKDSDGASTEALYAYATKKHFIIHGK